MISFDLYHATDASCIDKIQKNGFLCKENPSHWLGNGIYFYFDLSLAQWWTTKPTKQFGTEINDKCILKASVSFDEQCVLDLRKMEDYKDCVQAFHTFDRRASQYLALNTRHSMEAYRCAFFDWLFKSTNVDCIIGCFSHDNKAYLRGLSDSDLLQLKDFQLPFVETQVCIRSGYIKTDDIKEVIR